MIYVKAGGAWGKFNYDDFVTAGGALNGSSSGSRWGWALGGGMEYALAANWSAKVEYNYLDFNAKRMGFSGGAAGGYTQDVNQNVQLLKTRRELPLRAVANKTPDLSFPAIKSSCWRRSAIA